VRRYVPEFTRPVGASVHEAWEHRDGVLAGCVERIVDHAAERAESLTSYRQVRAHPVLMR
jgi:deoxyribodipyrimidine photolyase